jgi:hypothetical protein
MRRGPNDRFLIERYLDDASPFRAVCPTTKPFIHSRISSRTRRKIESRSSSLPTPGGGVTEAMNVMADWRPEIVIADIAMPDGD